MDSARLAARFPRAALHILSDSLAGSGVTSFPRRLGLFLTDRCNFACPMCAVQDARNEGLSRGGDLPFELLEKVLTECSPHQPAVDLMGGDTMWSTHLGSMGPGRAGLPEQSRLRPASQNSYGRQPGNGSRHSNGRRSDDCAIGAPCSRNRRYA
jgi:hypothetical protein